MTNNTNYGNINISIIDKGVAIMILVSIIVGIIVLVIQSILAQEFYMVAADKGYDNGKYFWFVFLFGVLGALLVVALPDRAGRPFGGANSPNAPAQAAADELPEL